MKIANRLLLGLCALGLVLSWPAGPGAAQGVPSAEEKNPRRFVRVPAPDGIQVRRYNKTDGRKPEKGGRIAVIYTGRLDDGTVVDSTNRPRPFSLNSVVPCWQKALLLLREGEKARLTCPPETAYGVKGDPPTIPPNSTLTFEIELTAVY